MTRSARHPQATVVPLSVEEYLRLEETSPLRHEYVAGERYAMTGGTLRHNRLTLNVVLYLRVAARGGPCQVYVNDVSVRAAPDTYYYPDVLVACEAMPDTARVVDAPCLIVEVTSPSTARTDRGEKLTAYRRIPTLLGYLVVDHERRRVTCHARQPDGSWGRAEATGSEVVALPCPATVLPLDVVYDEVEVPAAPRGVAEGAGAGAV